MCIFSVWFQDLGFCLSVLELNEHCVCLDGAFCVVVAILITWVARSMYGDCSPFFPFLFPS